MERQPSKRKSRGQALVEFVLVLPLLLLLIVGVFDFGRLFYSVITITNAAREGARYAILYEPNLRGNITSIVPRIQAVTAREASSSGIQIAPANVDANCIVSNTLTKVCQSGVPLRVNVDYQFSFVVNYIFSGSLTLHRQVEMLVP